MFATRDRDVIGWSWQERDPGTQGPGSRLSGNNCSKVSRREVLAGLGAFATFPLGAEPATPAAITYKVGAIEILVVSDGVLNVPLSFLLPETPLAEAGTLFKAHGLPEGGTPMQTNVLLVKTGAERILIDAGSGSGFQPTSGKLQENLEAAGIAPQAITKIVFTHAHADHLWGVLDDFGDGERFPNARYVIGADEWDFWTDPDTPTRLPDVFKGIALGSGRVLKAIKGKTERRKAGDTLAPGLSYAATPGHTPGHMAVLVEDGGQRLMAGGDVLANAAISFARPDWRIGSDLDRDRGITTRKRLLDQLATDRIPLMGFHLPWPGLGAVERSGTAYRFIPL